jgi:DNA-binding phage protein
MERTLKTAARESKADAKSVAAARAKADAVERRKLCGGFDEAQTLDLKAALAEAADIGQFINTQLKPFKGINLAKYLRHIIEKHGRTIPEIIKDSGLNPSFVYQVLSGNRNPSRNKLLSLCAGIRTGNDECNRALRLAGHSELYSKCARDAAISFGLSKGMSPEEINDLLDGLKEPTLS